MPRKLAALIVLLPIALLISCNNREAPPTPIATPSAPGSPTPSPSPATATPSLADVCAENPDPATPDLVQVDTPHAGDPVSNPVTVSGRIAPFEATFRIRIFDATGTVVAGTTGMSAEGQVLSSFSEKIRVDNVEPLPACIWVFESSAQDGRPIHVVQIPVMMQPPGSVCLNNPSPATADVVRVDTPSSGDLVMSPVTVSGQIAAFEATFRITIFDATGSQIADQIGMSAEGQVLSAFSEDVTFSVSDETPACLWVYENSAQNGEPIHVIQVPIRLEP